jgi:hypothetical protein
MPMLSLAGLAPWRKLHIQAITDMSIYQWGHKEHTLSRLGSQKDHEVHRVDTESTQGWHVESYRVFEFHSFHKQHDLGPRSRSSYEFSNSKN